MEKKKEDQGSTKDTKISSKSNWWQRRKGWQKFLIIAIPITAIIAIACILQPDPVYRISVQGDWTFDCNLVASGEDLKCSGAEITGSFSYEYVRSSVSVSLKSSIADLETTGEHFSQPVESPEIEHSTWETDSYNRDSIVTEHTGDKKITFSLSAGSSKVKSSEVTYRWNFTDADLALLDQKHSDWQTEQAAAKAAAEAAAAAAEAQKQNSSSSSSAIGCQNGSYINSSGNVVCRPSTTNTGGATAICKDGTYSYSQHRSGTCSHHGGVKQWL